MAFTLGIDYGSNSVRALVVDCANGRELGTCVIDYPSGEQGILLDPRDHVGSSRVDLQACKLEYSIVSPK